MPSRQLVPGQRLDHLCISIRPDVKAALDALARYDSTSISHVVRRMLDEGLERRGLLPVRTPVAL